ncbi:MAG: transcriptional repressor [Gammaproteobacteria bacterium]|nr:transcriptional repressor [Gammaproteobacteria bacterium]
MGSKQRNIILEELSKLKTHPSADELYLIVKKRIPNISLGTVYRNLNKLADDGMILKLGRAGEQKRFDGHTENHYHFVCDKCGKVYDLLDLKISGLENLKDSVAEHELAGYELEFFGTCSDCKKGEKQCN